MKTPRWLGVWFLALVGPSSLLAQTTEPYLPRPGAVVATDVIGEVTVTAGDQTKPVRADERVRVGVTLTTGRKSLATFELSNGSTLKLGSESELELEEFGQQPFSSSIKLKDEKEEPSISRTRLRLVRGDVSGEVKRLKTQRGSSFLVAMPAGTLRIVQGSFHMMARMTDLGLGVCTLELRSGTAEFEPIGGSFLPVPQGKKLAFALEIDRITRTLKISEMPKEMTGGKAAAKSAEPKKD